MKLFKIIFLLFTLLSSCIINAQQKGIWDYPGKPGLWDYPVKPGTEEWKQFKSHEEKRSACQIPEELLSSLSTDDLADLCMRYPLLGDILAFDNKNSALDKLFRDFNGIRELYKRKDVSSNLNGRYTDKIQSFSFLNGSSTSLEKGFFLLSVDVLELLLSRIDNNGSEDKKVLKEVLQNLVTGYEKRFNYHDYFKGGFKSNFFARANIIAKIDSAFIDSLPNKELNFVFNSGWVYDEETLRIIDQFSYRLIK